MNWSMQRALGVVVLVVLVACGEEEPRPTPQPDNPTGPVTGGVPEVAEGSGPLVAPAGEWAWAPFSGSRCMNGSATGLGVNLSTRSDKVLVYLEGGGACFNSYSCTFMVANANGYGKTQFNQWVDQAGRRGVFDRGDMDNPFRDWSYIYVPYCSGDVHAGSNASGPGGRMHLGAVNMDLYLRRLVPTFANASQVVLSGTSAGGAGAALNYDRVQQAFGSTPVLLLDDSAPVFSDAYLKPCLQRQWREAWKLNDSLPADCTECRTGDGGLVNVLPFLARKYPQRRMAMVISNADATFRAFFGFGYSNTCTELSTVPVADFQQGVADLRNRLAGTPNFRLYSPAAAKHGYLDDMPLGRTSVAGVKLTDWLRTLVGTGPGWEHITQ
jgi:hypothetical protein